jgi:hypothetical protein
MNVYDEAEASNEVDPYQEMALQPTKAPSSVLFEIEDFKQGLQVAVSTFQTARVPIYYS